MLSKLVSRVVSRAVAKTACRVKAQAAVRKYSTLKAASLVARATTRHIHTTAIRANIAKQTELVIPGGHVNTEADYDAHIKETLMRHNSDIIGIKGNVVHMKCRKCYGTGCTAHWTPGYIIPTSNCAWCDGIGMVISHLQTA